MPNETFKATFSKVLGKFVVSRGEIPEREVAGGFAWGQALSDAPAWCVWVRGKQLMIRRGREKQEEHAAVYSKPALGYRVEGVLDQSVHSVLL